MVVHLAMIKLIEALDTERAFPSRGVLESPPLIIYILERKLPSKFPAIFRFRPKL